MVAYTFTASATDPDLPANGLTFSLDGAPAGASIDPLTGEFSWTPSEAQGPGVYTFDVVVTDDGTPVLDDTEEVTLTVLEVNRAPTVAPIADDTIPEMVAYTFTASATDPDLPANGLTFSLDGAPAGASIDPLTGEFSWTPSEAQGPGVYTFDVVVTDDGTPVLDDTEEVTLTVLEVNRAPTVAPIADDTIPEMVAYTFTASATDPDLPANGLTFSLDGAPAGASIDPLTGEFSWTPSEAQGPGVYTFDVVVTDDGTPVLDDTEEVTLTVLEVNRAPTVAPIADDTIPEMVAYTFTASATDPDLPANGLTFSLDGAPAGASIDPLTGEFSWTPSEAQGPGVYTFDVVVTDDGTPVLDDTEEVTLTVLEVNRAPTVAPIADDTIPEMVAYTFTASATDPDLPANGLTFSLDGAPAGASIDPLTGEFSWTPSEAQGPGVYTFDVVVTDDGTPVLDDTEEVTLTVLEVNRAPVLGAIGNKSLNEGGTLTFTATATDPDIPVNGLTFSLTNGTTGCGVGVTCAVPAGASINPTTGAFTWTTPDSGTFRFKVVVTDDGSPVLSDNEEITVTVNNVNPTADLANNGPINEGGTATISFSNQADPSTADTAAGFHYAYSCSNASLATATYALSGTSASTTCSYPDGPSTHTVRARIIDKDGGYSEYTTVVTVNNVKPVVTFAAIAVDPVTGVISSTMTYADVGVNDTQTATFEYRLNGVLVATHTSASTLPSSGTALDSYTAAPGCYTVEVTMWVTDKDGASSDHAVRNGFTPLVDIYTPSFKAPIKNNERNIAKYGNVVPIKVELASNCSPGTTVTSPVLHITIALGNVADVVPDATPVIVAESVSNADTGTQMRVNGGGYIYNFTTKNLTQGQDYTIRIRVGSTTGPIILRALFQPKK